MTKKLPSSERAESWEENVRNFLWRQNYKMSENFDIFKISNPHRNHYEYKFRNRQTSQSKRISVLRFLSGQGAAVLQVTSLKVKIKPFPFKWFSLIEHVNCWSNKWVASSKSINDLCWWEWRTEIEIWIKKNADQGLSPDRSTAAADKLPIL